MIKSLNESGRDLSSERSTLSVVIPCFNEESALPDTYSKLISVLEKCGETYRLLFVDDGSSDNTESLIREFCRTNSQVQLVSLSRNFGHQIAVTAGIDAATDAEAIVIIDADLQDPPEVILEMLDKWRDGADVVYAVRLTRAGESMFKVRSATYFYRFLKSLSDTEIPENTGDFRLINKRVADAFRAMPERSRFIRGMISWVGFNQVPVFFNREARQSGETKYPLNRMIELGIDGIISFSTKPLRVGALVGLFICVFAAILGLVMIALRLFGDSWVEGWTLLYTSMIFLGGIQLFFLGLLGEYVAKIYNEVKRRPLYFTKPDTKSRVAE